MRSDEMTMAGDGIDVVLSAATDTLQEVFAEGDVDVRTAEGNATGDTARYLPTEESFTISGASATFESGGKLAEGKQLTFVLADDRILVDGREQSRTTTKYNSSKPRPF